jgi:hypothetical protein
MSDEGKATDGLIDRTRVLVGMLRKAGHTPSAELHEMAVGVPLVRVRCDQCGAVAATVEGYGQKHVRVLVGRVRGASLAGIACPTHGPLDVTWESLAEHVAKARERHRPGTVRASSRSTP